MDAKNVMNMDVGELKLDYVRLLTENEFLRSQLSVIVAERNILFGKVSNLNLPDFKKLDNQGQQKSQQNNQNQNDVNKQNEFILPVGLPRSQPPVGQNGQQMRPPIEKPKIQL